MTELHHSQQARNSGFMQRILTEAFSQWSARIGLSWIFIIVLLAVFAPFIANSHPIILKDHGVLHSPLLNYLEPVDVILPVLFFAGLILLYLRWSLSRSLLALTVILSVTTVLAYRWINPPQLTVYEQYRIAEAAGEYEWVVRTPIPFSPKDYQRDKGSNGLLAPLSTSSARHWFGTEQSGSDVLSRMIHASRIALGIGFVATGIALLLGIIIGGLMGFYSGIVDMIGMRLVEIFESIPTLFLLLTFIAFFGRSLYLMMVIIGITTWPGYARYVRAEFLRLRKMEYVQSAIASGLPLPSILFRHMLPNGLAPVLVGASFGVASAILLEATLSFLGLGLVDNPSWGQLLNQAVQSASFYWWLALFPGGAIFLTVFAYNLIGEALRDAIDPYLKKKV